MKRKKSRKSASSHQQNKTVFRNFEETPTKYKSKIDPINLEEQKQRFLNQGIIPQFQFKSHHGNMEISNTKKGQIEFDYLSDAMRILEKVRIKFGCGDRFLEEAYGNRIECDHASAVVSRYMIDNGVDGMMTVSWSKDLSCSGRMSWVGPCTKYNKPEARKYAMWIKNSLDNAFLREKGIKCLADHEIGTHFFRNLNDGLQPWFSDRQRFGLRALKSQALLETEEGLAAINTLLQSNHKLLFFPALTYYTACKAAEMSFQELFDHLHLYIRDSNLRWKYVMRVKRGLQDANDLGGYGKDQCYFSGAVEILRNMDKIDFNLLYSGKVCLDELPRVKRLARLDCLKLPHFMRNVEEYRKHLKHIATVNGLQPRSAKKSARLRGRKSSAYIPKQFSAKSSSRQLSGKSSSSRQLSGKSSSSRQLSEKSSSKKSSPSSARTGAPSITEVRFESKSHEKGASTINDKPCIITSADDTKSVCSSDYSSSVPSTVSRAGTVRLGTDDLLLRPNQDDVQSITSGKSHSKSEHKGSTYSPLQSCSSYSWRSIRTPSPALPHCNEDSDSPIPYSPSRWLRRRKMSSPNVLKQESKHDIRGTLPTSIVRF